MVLKYKQLLHGAPPDPSSLHHLRYLADLLDDRFKIPGTRWRFGLDSLIGLIPGIGDGLTAAVSVYIIAKAHRSGVSKAMLMRMLGNVLLDLGLGSVPLLGDLFDVGWKANKKNITLLLHHLGRELENNHR